MDYRLTIPDDCDPTELRLASQQIPMGTTWLDLSGNDLNRFSAADLVAFFKLLPATIKTLDLSANGLGEFKSSEELNQCFTAIPKTTKRLILNHNCFGHKNTNELLRIFVKVSKQLIGLHLKNDSIDESDFKKDFPESIRNILSFEHFLNEADCARHYLLNWLTDTLTKESVTTLTYQRFNLPIELNTSRSAIIKALKAQNTPLAFFCCGLLMEGRINEAHRVNPLIQEKRILRALDYYQFAAQNSELKIYVNFLLWHIKTTTPFFLVSKKINALNDFTFPKDIFISVQASKTYWKDPTATFFRNDIGKENWEIRRPTAAN